MGDQVRVYRAAADTARTELHKAGMTDEDMELAKALFNCERHGDVYHSDKPPPIYVDLAFQLRQLKNRSAIMTLLMRSVKSPKSTREAE